MSSTAATVRVETIGASDPRIWRWAALAGGATGVAYVLSPLSIVAVLMLAGVLSLAVRGLPADERRRVLWLLGAAIALRVAAIAALFITANPDAGSFGNFFGDEWFYLVRGLRLYAMWMGDAISLESFIYAYDKTGYTSYQNVLVFLSILFGPAPYGIHMFNMAVFVAGTVLLYRVVRASYGTAAATLGLAYLLFLPSLFMWSVSALKESLYLFLTSVVLIATLGIARARAVVTRVAALALVIAAGWWLDTLRVGGEAITLGGAAVGYLWRLFTLRRAFIAAAAAVFVVGLAVVWQRGIPSRVQSRLQQSARYHRGHVFTPGHSYKLLDQRFYSSAWAPLAEPTLTRTEAARYLIRATFNFLAQPLPWRAESKAELAYVPEQLVWYAALLLVPFGLAAGFKRDALLTCVLAGYTFVSAGVIALNSGNIGTLVRHRALVAPYLGWISALGLVSLLTAARRSERSRRS